MESFFGSKTPSCTEMLPVFDKLFPFFYLHSLWVLFSANKPKSESDSDIYLSTFKKMEDFVCTKGREEGSIFPLCKKSVIQLQFLSVADKLKVVLEFDGTKTFVEGRLIFERIFEKAETLWRDFPKERLLIKHHSNENLNPFRKNQESPDDVTFVRIPEGSCIKVLKPEIQIRFMNGESDSVEMIAEFKETDNVKAVKGKVIQSLTPDERKKIKHESLSVVFNEQRLKDNQRLMDLNFTESQFVCIV